jgi:hypothetical protein
MLIDVIVGRVSYSRKHIRSYFSFDHILIN